jgi:hypothetical protein
MFSLDTAAVLEAYAKSPLCLTTEVEFTKTNEGETMGVVRDGQLIVGIGRDPRSGIYFAYDADGRGIVEGTLVDVTRALWGVNPTDGA